jgi:non-ribosomal peptide synthase protein (TIGR01720 family)
VNKAFKTEINDILITALGMAIKETWGHNRILIALEGHGREEILEGIDISRTMGWFTSVYPVLMDISYAGDCGRQIKEIKENLRRIPNKGIGYGILKYLTREENKKEIEFKLKPQISFNYLGQFDADIRQASSFEIAGESAGNTQSLNDQREYLLDVSGIIANKQLTMTISYNRTHFKSETVAALFGNFESELRNLIAFCCSREKTEPTPADFTYKKLSPYIIEASKDSYQIIELTEKKDYYPLSSAQKRLFFLDRLGGNTTPYNEPTVMRVEGQLDRFKLEQAFEALIRRHESLRTSFRVVEGEPVQVIHESWEFDLTYMNIGEESIRQTIDGFIQPFNLDQAPLMRVGLVDFGIGQHLLLFEIHHIITDGMSKAIMVRDFLDAYQGKMPPVLSIQYKDYSQWQNRLLESDGFKKQEEYWLSQFKGELRPLELPTDYLRPSIQGFEGNRLVFYIDSELTEKIRTIVFDLNTTLYTGLLAVYYILLSKYTGQEDIFVGIPTSGRNRVDIERIIGVFVNTLPVRN